MLRAGPILLAIVIGVLVAGCGGGSGGSSSGSGGTTTGGTTSQNKDPAKALLAKAGLETCTETQSTAAAWYGTGFVQGRTFVVAPDCGKKPSVPTTVSGLTYAYNDVADKAAKAIRKSHPKAEVIQPAVAPYTTTVIVVQGPKAQEYAAQIQAALPKGS